jgi:hypothetical protein
MPPQAGRLVRDAIHLERVQTNVLCHGRTVKAPIVVGVLSDRHPLNSRSARRMRTPIRRVDKAHRHGDATNKTGDFHSAISRFGQPAKISLANYLVYRISQISGERNGILAHKMQTT